MRLAVIGDVEQGIHELMRYGAQVGFEMVHATDALPRELASTVHAVIYVVEGAIADVHDKLQELTAVMRHHDIKRLVIHAATPAHYTIDTTGIDWTIVHNAQPGTSEQRYDQQFAKFVIGQVTSAQHVNAFVTQPVANDTVA